MVTVENGRIRVTVSDAIADSYRNGFTGDSESQEQAMRGRILSTAMTKLASLTELRLMDSDPVNVAAVAHEILVADYLVQHGAYTPSQTILRHQRGDMMPPAMKREMELAEAYARGVLDPISDREARDFYLRAMAGGKELEFKQLFELNRTVELLTNRVGVEATYALERAAESIAAEREITRNFHKRRAYMGGWLIEVIGELPEQVGLSRLAG